MRVHPRPLAAVLAALLLSACRWPAEEEGWTVMSWNVQNLFDAADDGEEYSEFDPSGDEWDPRLYRRRLERTAEVVLAADADGRGPDVVVLQELENPGVLETLASDYLAQADYDYLACVPGYGLIRCGIMSRFPLGEVRVVDCGGWNGRSLRPVLAAILDAPGGVVMLVACHWKSPWNGREATEEARRREAAAVRDIVERRLENDRSAAVVVIGDLNTPGEGEFSPAALAPWEPDPAGGLADAALYRTGHPEGAGERGGKTVLFDPDPTSGPPGTYRYAGAWERPDRALLSAGLVDGRGMEFLSCRVGGSEIMAGPEGYPMRWISDFEEGYSDHFPLLLAFGSVP